MGHGCSRIKEIRETRRDLEKLKEEIRQLSREKESIIQENAKLKVDPPKARVEKAESKPNGQVSGK